ncbi:MAG TPA: MarR family transcriptional regulator [Jatrophihabitans sp.]
MSTPTDETTINRLRIAVARIARQLDRQSTQDGMTRTQLNVLGSVSRAKRISCSELADIEGVNPTMLSRILGRLEEQGFVRRVTGDADRRVIHAEITPSGSRAHLRMRRARTALLNEQIAALPAEDAAALLQALPALEALAGVTEAAANAR